MTFRVGDRIAHPMHGAGVIDSIVTKRINGQDRDYYVLKLPTGGMMVMVPVETCEAIGVRPIVNPAEAEENLGAIGTEKTCSELRAVISWRLPLS